MGGPAAEMTIGEFSRRSQLSLKALRLYERLGLLRPIAVDQWNGYRRYHESQLYTARLIVMLRLLDMPLPEVSKVVSASRTEAAEIIDSYWASAESRFAAQRKIMPALDREPPLYACERVRRRHINRVQNWLYRAYRESG